MGTGNEGTTPKPTHQPGMGKGEEMIEEEGKEPGRQDTGTTGAGRPAGTSTSRDSTGINPENEGPIDPNSPPMPPP